MRIIAGELRGRPLVSPPGSHTRPTTDRVREALFSSLISACASYQSLEFSEYAACDLFAGSGALSFEAISRGLAFSCCNDADLKARSCIQKNAAALGVSARIQLSSRQISERSYHTYLRELAHVLCQQGLPLGLIFLDPPYALAAESMDELVAGLCEHEELCRAPELLIVYERAKKNPGLSYEALELITSKNYGDSSIDLYLYES